MRRVNVIQAISFVLLALALVLVAGCAPGPTEVPTQVPTFTPISRAETATATLVVPSATPPVATATSIASVTDTPTSTQEAPTDTPAPPTDTPVPPTDTSTPPVPTSTATPVPPTNTPLPPTSTPLPPTPTQVQIVDWRGAYFDNRSVEGQPDVVRNDRVVDFDLAAGERPAPGIPAENWSARWSRQWTFDEGNYRFQLLVDDGARLWVNDNLLIDAWEDGPPREFAANLYLSGQATIRLDYYNHLGPARARLNWERVTQYPEWMGSYYDDRDLSGMPVFQRNDPAIDFNWGASSPRDDIPVDNFGVRWTRRIQLSQGGTYRFLVVSDDGARLWVDGRLIIDNWRDGYTTDEATIGLATGAHDVRLEYYEHLGGALIRLTWSLIPATATQTPIPPTSTPTTIPPTATRAPIPATFTPTSIPPTATRRPVPVTLTPTTMAPTATPTSIPPIVPPIEQAELRIQPEAGSIGVPISVMGASWPANAQIEIFLARTGAGLSDLELVGRVVAGPNGRFQTEIVVPRNAGWESEPSATIVARVVDRTGFAIAVYNIQGGSGTREVPFDRIPVTADRFALQQPTFLALDSAQAWAAHFGNTPPPASPPVDWQREYVLGAFLGLESGQGEVRVRSVTVEGDTVIVRLAGIICQVVPGAETGGVPRALIRVSRDALGVAGQPVFRFVGAGGQVLASGAAGANPLPASTQRLVPMPEAAGTPSAELAPGIQSVPEVVPEEAPAEAEAPMLQQEPGAEAVPAEEILPQAGAGEIGDIQAQVRVVPWQQTAAAWIALLAWGVLVVILIAGIFLVIRWAMRQS